MYLHVYICNYINSYAKIFDVASLIYVIYKYVIRLPKLSLWGCKGILYLSSIQKITACIN